jgi:hypothetical protein
MATQKVDVAITTASSLWVATAPSRGPISWNYFYIALGFVLSIWGTIIQKMDFLHFPYNVLLYVVSGAVLFWLFLFNGWFQNKLIGLKNRYEAR